MKQFSGNKKLFRHFRFFGLYLGVALCLFVWILSITGALNAPSSLLYDLFAQITPEQARTSDDILLVEADYKSRYEGDETWLHLLDTLEHKGVRQVIFYFFPQNVTSNFYQTAADLEYVIFGREVIEQAAEKKDANKLQPLPSQTAGLKIRTGVLPPSSTAYGIHRDYLAAVTIGSQSMPHITLLAAQERTGERYNPPNPFRVDFTGQHRSLPKISLSRVVSEDIIPELIKDKTVLVGFKPPFPFKGYNTPVNSSMSPLEYHGLALQTLLNRTELRFPHPWETLLCLLVLTGIALIIHQTFGSFIYLIMGGFLCVVTPLASWILLVLTKNWFPMIEVLLTFALFLFFISARDRLLRNRLALQILLDQSLKKQEKAMPKSFFRSEEYWPLIVNMVSQTLNSKRSIFLETVEGDHRVREVIALNISLEGIQERRRDYHRTPYKTAIEKNTAIPVDSYFKSLGDDEQPYIVPLNFFGQVQGFWAFTIDAEAELQTPELLKIANILAREIGEMLFRRKQWVEEGRWRDNPIRKLLNMEKHHEPYQEINRITAFLVRRLSMLESVFNALETGTILYNPFGMVVQSNQRMTQLLKILNINAYGISALDFAVQLTGESPEKIRQLLSRVIVNHETNQLSISAVGDRKQELMLKIRPFIASDDTEEEEDSAKPIEMNGFLFEIVDMPNLADSSRNDKFLAERPGVFSIDLLEIIKISIDNAQLVAEKRKILLKFQTSGTIPFIQAEPEKLTNLLEAILSLLIADALDDSTVMISVNVKQDEIICSLVNTGVGMPSETFQRFLTSPVRADGAEFQKIHRILPELLRWQATLSGSSDFGQGLSFKLILMPLSEPVSLTSHE